MKKSVVIVAGVLIMLAIVLGAMGAHVLKEVLSSNGFESYKTATQYQMYMGLALLILGLNYARFRKQRFKWFFGLILTGTLLFCLSIYGLVFLESSGSGLRRILGPITPLGGTLMIIGWLVFIFQFFMHNENE